MRSLNKRFFNSRFYANRISCISNGMKGILFIVFVVDTICYDKFEQNFDFHYTRLWMASAFNEQPFLLEILENGRVVISDGHFSQLYGVCLCRPTQTSFSQHWSRCTGQILNRVGTQLCSSTTKEANSTRNTRASHAILLAIAAADSCVAVGTSNRSSPDRAQTPEENQQLYTNIHTFICTYVHIIVN